jgi:hypothetical protein
MEKEKQEQAQKQEHFKVFITLIPIDEGGVVRQRKER